MVDYREMPVVASKLVKNEFKTWLNQVEEYCTLLDITTEFFQVQNAPYYCFEQDFIDGLTPKASVIGAIKTMKEYWQDSIEKQLPLHKLKAFQIVSATRPDVKEAI